VLVEGSKMEVCRAAALLGELRKAERDREAAGDDWAQQELAYDAVAR